MARNSTKSKPRKSASWNSYLSRCWAAHLRTSSAKSSIRSPRPRRPHDRASAPTRHLFWGDYVLSHLLVVDDDEQFRGYVVAMLRKRGYEVTEASNGRRALRILETTQVDIIITDIVMPDMEGLEAIRHFRVTAPDAKIVAMSGGGSGDVDYLHFAA